MEDKERREEEYSLDDIMQEFRKPEDAPLEEAEELTAVEPAEEELLEAEETEAEAVSEETEQQDSAMSGDTVRLDLPEILHGVASNAQHIDDEDEPAEIPQTQEETPAFTEGWEPEYEQPMGEYVPPKPIAFPTRAESRDMYRERRPVMMDAHAHAFAGEVFDIRGDKIVVRILAVFHGTDAGLIVFQVFIVAV